MAKEHILIVEDEEDILELIRYNLAKDGYRPTCVASGEDALKQVAAQSPDLILLDLMLPGIDGLEVCKALRSDAITRNLPIIMLTAKAEESDIVTGLALGADDYITKPFSPRVLIARVRAVLRRKDTPPPTDSDCIEFPGLLIHPGRHEVRTNDKPTDLSVTEFKLLHYLARRPGWVFTRDQIISAVHGSDYPVTDRSVDVQIVGLRKKLGDAGQCIETVRGVGYRFREQS